MSQYDVVVIGAGPGGYITATRVAQLGFKTACVDAGINRADDALALGGTCLNVSYIPSKTLLQSGGHFHVAQHEFAEHGITVGDVKFDVAKMIECKDAIVTKLTGGMKFLFQKNKVTNLFGTASFVGKNGDTYQIEVDDKGEKTVIEAKHVIVATGSVPRPLPQAAIDDVNVLDNEGTLSLTGVPAKLGVVGSGVIGLGMDSVWNRVGAEATILGAASTFLTATGQQIAEEAFKYFTKEQGLSVELSVKISDIRSEDKGVSVTYEAAADETETEVFNKLIITISHIPDTRGLNTEAVGLGKDKRGFIKVDGERHADLPNVWAIGDVVRGPMLAHKASDEGVVVAERIAGQKPHIDFSSVPLVIYTGPEIAWVGRTEEQLKAGGVKYKKGTSGFGANGYALTMDKARDAVKVLADAKTDRILGVHMIGPIISELVTESATALGFFASNEDIARVIHVHPALSEMVHETTLATDKHALHG